MECYRQAVKLRPDSPETLMNFGVNLGDLGEIDEAIGYVPRVTQTSARLGRLPCQHGKSSGRKMDLDGALDCYEQALRLRPDFPEARRNRSYIWLCRGDFARGWAEYEWRLKCEKQCGLARRQSALVGREPRRSIDPAGGRARPGRYLAIHPLRALVKQRAGRVIFACPAPLMRLVARCPGVDQVVDLQSPLPDCDVHTPLLSLPSILGTTEDNVPRMPYLTVDAGTSEDWRPIVAAAFKRANRHKVDRATKPDRAFTIGIAWQGNHGNTVDHLRSFPLSHFEPLAGVPGVRLISLQKGDGTEQLDLLDGRFTVAELSNRATGDEDRRDFLDTAAVICQLDLVMTPDSSVAHLAGGIGVPVWIALPFVAEWRWLIDRDDCPWYPTMRLFRQSAHGDWAGVFQRMAQALRQVLATRNEQLSTPAGPVLGPPA